MTNSLVEFPHDFGCTDDSDMRDLLQTTPLLYDADGLPVGYDAEQLFGLEAAYFGKA